MLAAPAAVAMNNNNKFTSWIIYIKNLHSVLNYRKAAQDSTMVQSSGTEQRNVPTLQDGRGRKGKLLYRLESRHVLWRGPHHQTESQLLEVHGWRHARACVGDLRFLPQWRLCRWFRCQQVTKWCPFCFLRSVMSEWSDVPWATVWSAEFFFFSVCVTSLNIKLKIDNNNNNRV